MIIQRYLSAVIKSIKKRGLVNTVLFLMYELIFELKYRVYTIGRQSLDAVTVSGPNKAHGYDYQGYSYYYFRKFMSRLPVDFRQSVFIDFGSGKGRMMIMAAAYGFKRIHGVEFGVELFEAGLHNIKKAGVNLDRIEVICGDVCDYPIPEDANVLCFYNPFDRFVLDKVLENIEASLQRRRRNVYLLYFTPLFEDCFVQRGYSCVFKLRNRHKLEGVIYMK